MNYKDVAVRAFKTFIQAFVPVVNIRIKNFSLEWSGWPESDEADLLIFECVVLTPNGLKNIEDVFPIDYSDFSVWSAFEFV